MKKYGAYSMIVLLSAVCVYSKSNGASYGKLNEAFEKAERPALFQAKAVDDLTVASCPESFICQCNLVMAVDKAINEGTEPDYEHIIKEAQGACQRSVIDALKVSVGAAGADTATFLKKLYDTSLIIKDVTPPASIINEGRFTANNLASYLQKAIDERKLFDLGLQQVVVTDIATEGGAATLELFFVKNPKTGQEWIIKGIPSPKKEAFALSIVAQTQQLAPIIQPKIKVGFPVLSLPISYLGYTIGNKQGVLAVMKKASGSELFKYMQNYVDHPDQTSKKNLREAYRLVGQTLGNFHKTYRKAGEKRILGPTYTHGDFHARNVFVDISKKQVYWIDNERMGRTIFYPNDPTIDWFYLLFLTFNQFLASKLFKNAPLTDEVKTAWVQDFYPAFVHAYLDAFGAQNKSRTAQEMKDMLVQTKNPFHDEVVLREITALLDGILAPTNSEQKVVPPQQSNGQPDVSADVQPQSLKADTVSQPEESRQPTRGVRQRRSAVAMLK